MNLTLDQALKLALDHHHAGQFAVAAQWYQQILQHVPEHVDSLQLLGTLYAQTGEFRLALPLLERAVAIKPDYLQAYNNLGNVYLALGMVDGALASFGRALELQPDYADGHYNLGNLLQQQQRRREAATHYLRAWQLQPTYSLALGAAVFQLQHLCAWDEVAGLLPQVEALRAAGADFLPFPYLALSTTAAQQRANAVAYCRHLLPEQTHTVGEVGKGKPRIGYLSGDFQEHATSYLMAELLEAHDRSAFDIILFSYGADDGGSMRRRILAAGPQFVDICGLSPADAAALIAQQQLDILVDLKGHTEGAQSAILSYRPAPLQVQWLGYPGTWGAPYIDYLIADAVVIPPGAEVDYTEHIVRLPHSYQVNDRQRQIDPHTPSRAECGLPEQGLVLCSFNQSYKIGPELFACWMDILHCVPDAVLWLLELQPEASACLRQRAHQHGVDPSRLVFASMLPLPQHLARYHLADLMLDTYPVNAHTTASDALWVGCPLVTRAGNSMVSRVAASLLTQVGLTELITDSWQEYSTTIKALLADLPRLQALRHHLHNVRDTSPLFDSSLFARNLEQAYTGMVLRAREGKRDLGTRASGPPDG